ncbi:putative membrane protein [Mycobacterium intracellulare 1956]|uniref:Putative membrane protein n=1 Tax=Mycobacterium intracellulare 1956 TaxID=1299331 RepID=X8CBR8_MYCIT|nr:putative membrane protein [Mycobacterium intracellulare 1956]
MIGSDPGLLRLRMATRTTAALGLSLLVLFVLTRATGQPLTVALLGVVITMVASRSVNEPDPRQQRITMALLPVPAALAITAAALLAPHVVASDAVFVLIVFTAAYIRRFGARGRALGMVAFMSYFFTLYLRARVSELPWMIGAVAVGTVCTYVMTAYVLPDRPERVLRATIRALRARMAIVIDTTAEAVRAGRLDERRRRRMRARTTRLNETALLVQSQIEDKADPGALWPGVTAEQLAPWLLDAELAIEWVATAGRRAAAVAGEAPESIPIGTRVALVDALSQLARAIRLPEPEGCGGRPPRATAAGRAARGWSRGRGRPGRHRGPSPRPGDHQRRGGDVRRAGDRRSDGRRRPPLAKPAASGRRPPSAPRRRRPPTRHALAGCCRPPGKPSRSVSPPRWPSSPGSWSRRTGGIGR